MELPQKAKNRSTAVVALGIYLKRSECYYRDPYAWVLIDALFVMTGNWKQWRIDNGNVVHLQTAILFSS